MSEPARELLEHVKRLYPSAGESATQWLESKDSHRADATVDQIVQDRTIVELIGMLEQNWRNRILAIRALAEKCETREDVEEVLTALNHRNTRVRIGAVKALGGMQHLAPAREAIREGLNAQGRTGGGHVFPRWDIRRTALKFYVRSDPPPPDAVDILLNAVDEWRSATAVHDAVAEFRRYLHDDRIVSKLRELVSRQRFPMRARRKAQRVLRHVPDGR